MAAPGRRRRNPRDRGATRGDLTKVARSFGAVTESPRGTIPADRQPGVDRRRKWHELLSEHVPGDPVSPCRFAAAALRRPPGSIDATAGERRCLGHPIRLCQYSHYPSSSLSRSRLRSSRPFPPGCSGRRTYVRHHDQTTNACSLSTGQANTCFTNGCLHSPVDRLSLASVEARTAVLTGGARMSDSTLAGKRRRILEFIAEQIRERGYPPSVREIGEAVGLTSPSTVHTHLQVLQRQGYLQRDPTKPRAIIVRWEPSSGAAIRVRPVAHVPLSDMSPPAPACLREETVEELLPIPAGLHRLRDDLFMLKVRGDSMIDAGILDGDYVVVRRQPDAESGDIVVAGIGEDEATVKTFRKRRGRDRPRPGQPGLRRDGARRRPGRDLRQGRHRAPAPELSQRTAPRAGLASGPAALTSSVRCRPTHRRCGRAAGRPGRSSRPARHGLRRSSRRSIRASPADASRWPRRAPRAADGRGWAPPAARSPPSSI